MAREDYTYEKEGRANLFIAYEPLAGKRLLKVTEQRTKKDWAFFMQEVLEEQYPEANKVVVVMDNLNTHTPASFYEVFPPESAYQSAAPVAWGYTEAMVILTREAICSARVRSWGLGTGISGRSF